MKINARIVKTFKEGSIKAIADLTLDDAIAVHGVKLIDGKNGQFVSMPSDKWQDKEGNYKHTDIVHPVTAETRSDVFHAVVDAYNNQLQAQSQKAASAPAVSANEMSM